MVATRSLHREEASVISSVAAARWQHAAEATENREIYTTSKKHVTTSLMLHLTTVCLKKKPDRYN